MSVRMCVRQLHAALAVRKMAGLHPRKYFVPHVFSNGATTTVESTIKPTQPWKIVQEDIFNTAPWDPTAVVVKDKGGQVAKFNQQLEEHEFVVPTFGDDSTPPKA
ncbi:hypothetical protein PTSG_10814 [Salpingoeca rosetta]|uniref:Uncharacterized protein n=1 Tax=Salpingoeca rosetta (strain ATCC 50818 / BSB-021) TaxID=946362 RepID=F2UQ01_SALR5|nr:uncharacterized protein PTSG_10814 [Salpingoeca rosetta]EGD79831.1 hypothetical protein PTSG_10814 [Salpingoeca rosetta]|eukprot:XP_004988779.1 hypothetical protein PTSG_10814 [Salpingoeca rosetta]